MNKEKLHDALFAGFVLFVVVAGAAALVVGPKLATNPVPPQPVEFEAKCMDVRADGDVVVLVCYRSKP